MSAFSTIWTTVTNSINPVRFKWPAIVAAGTFVLLNVFFFIFDPFATMHDTDKDTSQDKGSMSKVTKWFLYEVVALFCSLFTGGIALEIDFAINNPKAATALIGADMLRSAI
jgi:hypothetical protein